VINEATRLRFLANTSRFGNRLHLMHGLSQSLLPTLADEAFDFVFVDGDHRPQTVAQDAFHALRLLRAGGLLLFDDYRWGYTIDRNISPKDAIDEFLVAQAGRLQILAIGSQVAVLKVA
jgi:predicted O-methyltransferase YrrM